MDKPNDASNDFHLYSIEWTETEIRFFIDNKQEFIVLFEKEIGDYYNPFINKSFKLAIGLELEENNLPPEQDDCSLLIIDYVRVYEISYELQ